MPVILLYLLVAYSVAALAALAVLLRWRTSASQHRRVLTAVSVLMAMPLVPYLVVWVQTALLGGILAPAAERSLVTTGVDAKLLSLRVHRAWPSGAQVYAVVPCTEGRTGRRRRAAWVVSLVGRHGRWYVGSEPDCIWSECGSANGNVFPPYLGASELP